MKFSDIKIRTKSRLPAFTLLEVMIATAIFFMAMFSILAVVSQSLRSARMLNRNTPTPGMVAAELSLTNKLEEGVSEGDFGDLYPGYTWTSDTFLYGTNGLYLVEFVVYRDGDVDSMMSALLFKPESTTGIGVRSRFR